MATGSAFDVVEFYRFNPVRPLDWRSRVAERALATDRGPKTSDRCIDGYTDFLRLLRSGRLETASGQQVLDKHPCLPAVHDLAVGAANLRILAEAWILTGADDVQIAGECGLAPEVIDWFEHLFFNVRDRLSATDWIVKSVGITSYAIQAASGSRRRELLSKTLAYHGGKVVLRAFLAEAQNQPATDDDVRAYLDRNVETDLRWATLETFYDLTPTQLLRAHARIIAAERRASGIQTRRWPR